MKAEEGSLANVSTGGRVVSDFGGRSHIPITGTVMSATPARFVVMFPITPGVIDRPWHLTFRRRDGRSVGGRGFHWARLAAVERKVDRATVRAVLDLLTVEGSGFYYNEANNYGVVNCALYLDAGDPSVLYRGEELMGTFGAERRGTGRYRLNEDAVTKVMELIAEQAAAEKAGSLEGGAA